MDLHVHAWGAGPSVTLIHGGVLGGAHAWRAQRPLAQRWRLLAPDRPGHGLSPAGRQDFEEDATLVARHLLGESTHLVGHSYGAIVAAFAAAQRPASVKSLTLIEPPASRVALDDPAVAQWNEDTAAFFRSLQGDGRTILRGFFDLVGMATQGLPEPLPPPLEQGARALVGARSPSEADLPLEALRAARLRVLVVSGGHDHRYETVCNAIAETLGASRQIVEGQGHLVQDCGDSFNEVLEGFLLEAESSYDARRTRADGNG